MLDTSTDTPRIYIACLASYNNGVMHGKWIDASADVDEMQDEVNAILRASPYPNVTVVCEDCSGKGYFHNAEDDSDNMMCLACKGEGDVPSAEEYAIHDFDGLPSTMGEYCGLQAVADYIEFIEACEDVAGNDAADLAQAMVNNWHSVEYAKNELDNLAGIYGTFREYADEIADEMIAAHTADGKAPQMLVNYFDYESHARDIEHSGTALDIPGGIAIFYK